MEQHDPSTMLADVVAAFFLRALANGIIYAFGSTSGIRKMVSYVGLTLVIIYLLFKVIFSNIYDFFFSICKWCISGIEFNK